MDYISMIRVNHPGIYFYSVVLEIILKLFTFVDENIHRKKLRITFFWHKSLPKQKYHFLSPVHSENFKACIWKVCLDAAKITEVQMISFLSYGGYKMP